MYSAALFSNSFGLVRYWSALHVRYGKLDLEQELTIDETSGSSGLGVTRRSYIDIRTET